MVPVVQQNAYDMTQTSNQLNQYQVQLEEDEKIRDLNNFKPVTKQKTYNNLSNLEQKLDWSSNKEPVSKTSENYFFGQDQIEEDIET